MTRQRAFLAALILASFSAAGAFAQAPNPPPGGGMMQGGGRMMRMDPAARDAMIEQRFKAADKDHDGSLTKEEAQAGMPRVAAMFDQIDRDHKGYVTLDEIKAAMASMMRSR